MNPTKQQLKSRLGIDRDSDLAAELGISKQAVCRQEDDDPVPDAWCWRAIKDRRGIFGTNGSRKRQVRRGVG